MLSLPRGYGQQSITGVRVEETKQGDHYDPVAKAVYLSSGNFHVRSLTAITVAAHEVGHAAIQVRR